MGRHRRSAATPAVRDGPADAPDRRRSARRAKRRVSPVRTGLIGACAALVVGAVAVASGLLPGGDTDTLGGAPSDRVRAEGSSGPPGRGGSTADRSDPAVGRGAGRTGAAEAQSPSAPASPSAPSRAPGASAPADGGKPSRSTGPTASGRGSAPSEAGKSSPATRAPAPSAPRPKGASPAVASARAQVLALVNQERTRAGCGPVTADASLTSLAQDFSADMAARGFFGHTDPDGRSPWDRASDAGVRGPAAENIARGQADAHAVMDAWMNSEGHRRNILDCDFRTLGVGVHHAPGGPWWTQEFGS